jgi:hypothetical protein
MEPFQAAKTPLSQRTDIGDHFTPDANAGRRLR